MQKDAVWYQVWPKREQQEKMILHVLAPSLRKSIHLVQVSALKKNSFLCFHIEL